MFKIVRKKVLNPTVTLMEVEAPFIAKKAEPGQFIILRVDESGERKRKSFSGTTKAEVNKKMTEYIAAFNDSIIESQETKKRLSDSIQNWLEVFKFPSVERTTYDRYECTAKNQIYPYNVVTLRVQN